jgi:hypothetical protein
MQNDSSSDHSSGDSAASPIDNASIDHVGFSITDQDTHILNEYLDDFQQADSGARADIIQKAMAEIYQLRPSNPSFDKKEASKVLCVYLHINALHSYEVE